jgi:hypothetical protein
MRRAFIPAKAARTMSKIQRSGAALTKPGPAKCIRSMPVAGFVCCHCKAGHYNACVSLRCSSSYWTGKSNVDVN